MKYENDQQFDAETDHTAPDMGSWLVRYPNIADVAMLPSVLMAKIEVEMASTWAMPAFPFS